MNSAADNCSWLSLAQNDEMILFMKVFSIKIVAVMTDRKCSIIGGIPPKSI